MSTPDQVAQFYGDTSDALADFGDLQGDGLYLDVDIVLSGVEHRISIDSAMSGHTAAGADLQDPRIRLPEASRSVRHRQLLEERLGWLSLIERATDGYGVSGGLSYTVLKLATDTSGFSHYLRNYMPADLSPEQPVIFDYQNNTVISQPLDHPVLSEIHRNLPRR
jgi:hypothetical protein